MLGISRKTGEAVIIRLGNQTVRVLVLERHGGGKVRLGFEADRSIVIDREEVHQRKERERQAGK